MNRKIKFKAWVMKEKEMTEVLSFEMREDGKLYVLYKDNTKCTLGKFAVELLQFTGLIDKKGREIYEGDVVSIRIAETSIEHKTVVKFRNGAFIANIIDKNDYIYIFHHGFNKDDFEVLGNIYENSELVEE